MRYLVLVGSTRAYEGFKSEQPLAHRTRMRARRMCLLLEGALLSLAGRYEPFSRGRGLITPEKIEEIWALAQEHGIVTAPPAIAELS